MNKVRAVIFLVAFLSSLGAHAMDTFKQAQVNAAKAEQLGSMTAEQRAALHSAVNPMKKEECKPTKKSASAAKKETTPKGEGLTAAWVIQAKTKDLYDLFDLNAAIEDRALLKKQTDIASRYIALLSYFEEQKKEYASSNCSSGLLDAIDEAIERITAFRDHLLEIRLQALEHQQLFDKLLDFQKYYLDAKRTVEAYRNIENPTTAEKEAYNAAIKRQREYAFKAQLLQDYAITRVFKTSDIGKTILNFNIDIAVSGTTRLNIDVEQQMYRVGDIQRFYIDQLNNNSLTEADKKSYIEQLDRSVKKIDELKKGALDENSMVALGSLITEIEALKKKINASAQKK